MIGNIAPRWPTQTLGGLLSLIVVGVLYWLSHLDLRPGLLAALSLSLVALIALALSFTRGDPMPAFVGIRWDGLGSAAVLSLGLIALVVNLGK
jgi:prolipoprotein diacylglyceryltransferase